MKIRHAFLACLVLPLLASPSAHATDFAWLATPSSGDWNAAANWLPNGVPSTSNDRAVFGNSVQLDVTISLGVSIRGINFKSGADPFVISIGGITQTVEFTDFGVINNSASVQTFQTDKFYGSSFFKFLHNSRAGINVTYVNQPTYPLAGRNYIEFFDSSSADYATFISPTPVATFEGESGDYHFFDQASAGHAIFMLEEADFSGGHAGFYGYSTADHASFTVGRNSSVMFAGSGGTRGLVTAANATFVNLPRKSFDLGADVAFFDNSTAGDAMFTLEGGVESGGSGGTVHFFGTGEAGNAQFTIKGDRRWGGRRLRHIPRFRDG